MKERNTNRELAWSDLAAMSETPINDRLDWRSRKIETKRKTTAKTKPGTNCVLLMQIASQLM